MSKAKTLATTNHEKIQQWAEERGATPACVRNTGYGSDVGMLRLDFPGFTGVESLEPVTWDQWFEKFDRQHLALLYRESTAHGDQSNFYKVLSRESAAATRGETAIPEFHLKASCTEKAAAQRKAAARNARRSAEGRAAQKHNPIVNVSRKHEVSKPAPHIRPIRRRAA